MKTDSHYLATTGISDFWDIEKELLILGPWCLTGDNAEKAAKAPRVRELPSPWSRREAIKEAADASCELYCRILPSLGAWLNAFHHTDYPERYWRILIGPWALHFIEAVWERYARVANAIRLFPGLKTHIVPAGERSLVTHDTYDFYNINNKITVDAYNLQLFSAIIRRFWPENAVVLDRVYDSTSPTSQSTAFRRAVIQCKNFIDSFSEKHVVLSGMYRLSLVDMLRLELSGVCVKFFNEPAYPRRLEPDFQRRCCVRFDCPEMDEVKAFVCSLMVLALPTCYVERYAENARKTRVPDSVKAVGSSVGWYFDESFKFFAAEASLKGARLLDFQTGGGFGLMEAIPNEKLALEKDIFYSMGWKQEKTPSVKPLASPYLTRLRDTHRARGDTVLLIGTASHRYVATFQSSLLPEDMALYFKLKQILYDALRREARCALAYRPYFEVGWREAETIEKVMPRAKILRGGRLVDFMKRAKIVIIDHPATSFLEALTVNVPCVFFWDPEIFRLRPEAKESVELLRTAGILHDSPRGAAAKINEIWDDPQQWWSGKAVQEARTQFCRNWAYADPDWLRHWLGEFESQTSFHQ